MSKKISKYKIDRVLVKQLISWYEMKSKPDFVFMLLGAGSDPRDGSICYAMPSYETRGHLPFGDEYKVANEIKFEDITILLTENFIKQVDGGVICLNNELIRILPESEFDDRLILEGIYV